ncbi:histidinol-phosphatase [Roseivivax sp. CAU 1761]
MTDTSADAFADADAIAATAEALADAARRAILPHFRTASLDIANKASTGFDPVTAADRAAEAAMRAVLAERRPEDGILGEEEGHAPGRSGLTWVLDPIDGTRGFLAGTPVWGVLIAASDASGPRFGLIDQPYIGERFIGGLGRAEWRGPHGGGALATRAARPLSEAVLMTTFPEIGEPADRTAFGRVAEAAGLVRYGCDCYAYALLALGQVDLVIEAGLHPYDIHAPIAVIEAAGGIVTDWQGGPAHRGGRVIAAANAGVHRAALALLGADSAGATG